MVYRKAIFRQRRHGFLHRPNWAADSAALAHKQAGTHSSSLDGTGAHTRRRERQLTVRGYTSRTTLLLLRQFTGLVAVVPSTGLASTVVRDTAQARLWGEITAP